jgi:hypothetical protein
MFVSSQGEKTAWIDFKLSILGSSTILSGRRRRLREEEIHCEGWKMKEEITKKEKTYLLVPEPEASPGSSVPASNKPSDKFAASSTSSSGAAAASQTPSGRVGLGQGSKRNIDTHIIDALHAEDCQTTAAYNCTQISAEILYFGEGRRLHSRTLKWRTNGKREGLLIGIEMHHWPATSCHRRMQLPDAILSSHKIAIL